MPRGALPPNTGAPPPGPFSPVAWGNGTTYISGIVALDGETGKLVGGDVAAQTERIFAILEALLAAASKTSDDVIRVGVYMADLSHFAEMNAVYERHFSLPYPARTTIGVAGLPLGASIEIDAVVG